MCGKLGSWFALLVRDAPASFVVQEILSRSKTKESKQKPRITALTETDRYLERLANVSFFPDSASTGHFVYAFVFLELV